MLFALPVMKNMEPRRGSCRCLLPPPVAARRDRGLPTGNPYSLGGGMMGASSTGVERPRRGSSYAAPGAAGGVKPLDRPS